jgi:hypothetical protein
MLQLSVGVRLSCICLHVLLFLRKQGNLKFGSKNDRCIWFCGTACNTVVIRYIRCKKTNRTQLSLVSYGEKFSKEICTILSQETEQIKNAANR